MVYFIYMLECSNSAYYTGYTTDMRRRYQEHADGSSKCKYTRSFPPLRIAACWEITAELSIVLKIEREIKRLEKNEKNNLASRPGLLRNMLIAKGYAETIADSIKSCDEELIFSV